MRLKKWAALVMAAAMITGMTTGCGSSEQTAEPAKTEAAPAASAAEEKKEGEEAAAPAAEPRKITFASQSVGTTGYVRVSAFASVINGNLPEGWELEILPISSGGLAGTLLVEEGQCDIGEGISVTDRMLVNGEYGGMEPLKNTLGMFAGTDYAHFLIMFTDSFQKKTGYTTLEELIENKVPFRAVTKAPGSASEMGIQKLLGTFGITYDDIREWGGEVTQVAPNDMADLLKEGRADVCLDVVGLGQAALSELTMTTDMFFAQLSDETLKNLEACGYVLSEIEANSWTGQTEPLKTALQCSTAVVNKDLPDEVVYAIVKAICENKEALVEQVPALDVYFVPEKSGEPGRNGMALHPGAIKYYEEMGWEH